MAFKYLSEKQVASQLNAGKAVEQWLGHKNEVNYRVLEFMRIDCEKTGEYSITFFEVFDEGSYQLLDIYNFSPLEPDLPYGYTMTFDSKDEAINVAKNQYNASLRKYVNLSLVLVFSL